MRLFKKKRGKLQSCKMNCRVEKENIWNNKQPQYRVSISKDLISTVAMMKIGNKNTTNSSEGQWKSPKASNRGLKKYSEHMNKTK